MFTILELNVSGKTMFQGCIVMYYNLFYKMEDNASSIFLGNYQLKLRVMMMTGAWNTHSLVTILLLMYVMLHFDIVLLVIL